MVRWNPFCLYFFAFFQSFRSQLFMKSNLISVNRHYRTQIRQSECSSLDTDLKWRYFLKASPFLQISRLTITNISISVAQNDFYFQEAQFQQAHRLLMAHFHITIMNIQEKKPWIAIHPMKMQLPNCH